MMKKCMGCMRDYEENNNCCPVCGYSDAQTEADRKKMPEALRPATILDGRYILGRCLSCSDYSIVYIAWDALLLKRAAIKEYFPFGLAERGEEGALECTSERNRKAFERGMKYFEEEARTLGENQDIPEIVNVYRCVRENNTAYTVMEYIEGCTLQDRLDAGEENPDEIWQKTDAAVAAIREREIEHYGLTPDNIYIEDDGTVRLLDFGEAKRKLQRLVGKGMIFDMDRNENQNSFMHTKNTRGLGAKLRKYRIWTWILTALTILFASASVYFAISAYRLAGENGEAQEQVYQQETDAGGQT